VGLFVASDRYETLEAPGSYPLDRGWSEEATPSVYVFRWVPLITSRPESFLLGYRDG
jgi:hypothetical protein